MNLFHKKDKKVLEKTKETEHLIRKYALLDLGKLYGVLDSRPSGLTEEEVEEKLDENGENIIEIDSKNNMFNRLKEAIINPFNVVLLVIALITFFTDIIFTDNKEYLTVIIILLLVLISSLVAFIQGERSNKTAEKLTRMITNKVDVIRENENTEVIIEEITVGDIVKLSAGDMIPADVRFITTKDAFIAQAALTGESNPVEKFSEVKNNKKVALTDLANIGFMGSNMVSGTATAIVLFTGNDTYFGSMAKTLSGDKAKNSFERGIDSVSSLLIRFMLIMIPIIIIINGLTKHDWLDSILFAISIAVGLTPEMLPVIMTSTLAKGAIAMAKHKVIVKNLGSIQAFGEMDILCTDKTGTLTRDKIILEKYMNTHGEDDMRILRHAYLNSYYQTGLKNLIDIAIINRARENDLASGVKKYERVDEIPFDFSRRRMSVVLRDDTGKNQLITKGAVEEVLEICSYVEFHGEVIKLDEKEKEYAISVYLKHNNDGLRMLAIAQKNDISDIETFSIKDESNMVLIGFVGFLDPPKESAAKAITALKNHGVRTVVLTGDSEGVAKKVCEKVGIDINHTLTGLDVENMNDKELKNNLKSCNLFSKLSPSQKERVVKAFQELGHTVGYMGDGINDALPLRQSDVGISVDSAVDIAKETADIILLKKDLMVLEEGVIEGRKTFGNIIKYIKMATSGNFGNMFSVIIASIFLPFLPMLPIHILIQNLLCDFSQTGIAFDKVDDEYIKKPRKWDTKSIKNFMFFMGPISSVFDVSCFLILYYVLKANNLALAPLFQCGWFIFGTISQILIIHMIRTSKIPFIQSNASKALIISTVLAIFVTLIIGFAGIATLFDMKTLPFSFLPWLALLLAGYAITAQLFKVLYIKKFKEWL